jgi:hypothetical protein
VVEVDGRCYTAAHVVLATGSDPVVPPIPGLPELDGIWTNREVTGMKAVPHHLLILGGGPVGTEMAQAVRRLGGEVALVEAAGHVLGREPAPAVSHLLRDLRQRAEGAAQRNHGGPPPGPDGCAVSVSRLDKPGAYVGNAGPGPLVALRSVTAVALITGLFVTDGRAAAPQIVPREPEAGSPVPDPATS